MPTLLGDQLYPADKPSLRNQSVATRSTKVLSSKNKIKTRSIVCIPRSPEDTEIAYANKVLDYFCGVYEVRRENL